MTGIRDNGPMKIERLLLVVVALSLGFSGTAAAHGDVVSAIPPVDAKLGRPPPHIIINFSEPPTKNGVVKVVDGCKNNIVRSFAFEGKVAHVFLKRGEPGDWRVSYDIVSDADGHRTDGGYSLAVKGRPLCSRGGPEATDDEGAEPAPQAGSGGAVEEDPSLPVIPIVLGSAAVIVLAVLARRSAS